MGTGVKNIYHIDFGCVIYPSALEYFDVFVKSVSEQTEKAFDLLVMNDGAEVSVLEEKLHPLDGKYHIISVEDGLSKYSVIIRRRTLFIMGCGLLIIKEQCLIYRRV